MLTFGLARVLFLLGRPGSGKTSATKSIIEYLHSVGYIDSQIAVYNDYEYLFAKFELDDHNQNFEPGLGGGFRVKNFVVLDECLREINKDVLIGMSEKQFIIIELSRNQYVPSIQYFDALILDACNIVYLKTKLSICIQRNELRRAQEGVQGRGFVPLDVMETYYKDDDADQLNTLYLDRMVQIDNEHDEEDIFAEKIAQQVANLLAS